MPPRIVPTRPGSIWNEAPVRRLPALIVAATVLAALTACSGIDADDAAERCEDAPPSVDSTALIESSAAITAAPDVSFPTPLFADTVQASELIHGDGAPVVDGEPILLRATILDGGGRRPSFSRATTPPPPSILYTVGDPAVPGLGDGLACATVGSRVAVVTPPADAAAADSVHGLRARHRGRLPLRAPPVPRSSRRTDCRASSPRPTEPPGSPFPTRPPRATTARRSSCAATERRSRTTASSWPSTRR